MAVVAENIEIEDVVLLGNENELTTDVSKCPNCGANLLFSPDAQALKCDHCGTTVAIHARRNEEIRFEELLKGSNTWADETHVFGCNNCGAKQILSTNDIAKECAFCGTTNIVETDELSGLKPNAVVPFKISLETSAEKARFWAKKRFFAPNKFKKELSAEVIKGTYNPAFTFDTNTFSRYEGRLGKNYTTTVTVNGRTSTRTETRYFIISGTYTMLFDDILVQASSTITQKTIDKIKPFNTNDSCKYAKEFLNGFSANQYTKDGKECWEEARKVIDVTVRSSILSQYTYDVVDSLRIVTDCKDITYKYMLIPIYIGHFNFRAKIYNFFVNGYNGKVTGRYPISKLKVSILTVLAIAVIVGLGFLGYNLIT